MTASFEQYQQLAIRLALKHASRYRMLHHVEDFVQIAYEALLRALGDVQHGRHRKAIDRYLSLRIAGALIDATRRDFNVIYRPRDKPWYRVESGDVDAFPSPFPSQEEHCIFKEAMARLRRLPRRHLQVISDLLTHGDIAHVAALHGVSMTRICQIRKAALTALWAG
jgi:DNA-directed RNA polymerase specialized sigma subunit